MTDVLLKEQYIYSYIHTFFVLGNCEETVKACWGNCKTIMASPVILFHLLQHEREQQQLELKIKTISFPLIFKQIYLITIYE
jgi:hypothetical protein